MAQAIHCDVHGGEHLADVLVSQLANGETMAACSSGYLDLCRAYVAAADQAEAEATDAEATDRLAAVDAPADPTAPATVVRKGHSASRAAYEARRRATAAPVAAEPTQADSGAPGPSEADLEDQAEVGTPA